MIQSESADLQRLARQLRDPSPDVREAALDELGERQPAGALDMIIESLSDSDSEVRGTAAFNLGVLRDPGAITHLIDLVQHDRSEGVRAEALRSLAEFRDPSILPVLVEEVAREKKSRPPRQEVAKQLRFYDSDDAARALATLLDDDDVFVREDAAESLYALNRPIVRDAWINALSDRSVDVRTWARTALDELDSGESDPSRTAPNSC